MALTVKKTNDLVCRRLRYKEMPAAYPIVDVVNDAGWWLVGLRSWNWLSREPVTLDLTASQEYIELPADLLSAVGKTFSFAQSGRSLHLTSIENIARMRSDSGSGSDGGFWGAIVRPVTALDQPLKNPRIELYPEPTTAVTAAFSMAYRAGWLQVTQDSDHIVIPRWLDRVFIEACVAHVGSAEQEARGDLATRLKMVEAMIESVEHLDSVTQEDFGPMTGTAAQEAMGAGYEWDSFETPGGPVY